MLDIIASTRQPGIGQNMFMPCSVETASPLNKHRYYLITNHEKRGRATKTGQLQAPRAAAASATALCFAGEAGAALVLPYADKQAMTLHLAEISRAVAPGAHAVVIVDGAGWHKPGGRLRQPDNISMLVLPPYSPELNPQENIWQFLRQNYLSNRVFASYSAIVDACCAAWNALVAQSGTIASIASREWTQKVTV